MSDEEQNGLKVLSERIEELGTKASQLLTFLSFALVVAVLLKTAEHPGLTPCQQSALRWALRFWVFAIFPIAFTVLPVKEFGWENKNYYDNVRRGKFFLLWVSIVLVVLGASAFLCAIW